MAIVEHRVVVPLQRRQEQRSAQRFEMELPLALPGGATAITRDLSVSGLSFSSPQAHAVGDVVDVTVEYILDDQSFPLRCKATVVRCEPCADGTHIVGARLAAASLD